MKKIILILAVLFAFLFSSVSFASCNLDLSRWQWITSTDECGIYIDTQTIKYSNNNAEVWECYHYPHSCEVHTNIGEHYHYFLFLINYNNNTNGMKAYMGRDGNGRVLDSFSESYVRYDPIPPDSNAEAIAITVRKRFTRR